ncbi:uncharacterized protein TNCT_283791 [Trichonephila clavata]|uniref:Uncharacterized protein n=1 Tax=Trichonephila clavata TaxID=2740835 RepID=A0A8X6H092_TRICU|nr:uncharacterized protein TNCT_283791 [Trichonephila clavata]
MEHAILSLVATCAVAVPYGALHSGVGVLGPVYNAAPVVPVAAVAPVVSTVKVAPAGDSLSYTVTNVNSPTGAINQQTAVGKDGYGGHTIRHSAQASNVDPHTGQTDVKHDQHEFHINPFIGQAAVHTNNAEGSLNPSVGKAAFAQKTHEAKIAPGHASIVDVADTAAVSSHSSAASRDVNAARSDIVHDGIAKNAHSSHKSYVNAAGVGAASQAHETNHRSFDGHGYGNLHYDSQSKNEAFDVLGHASENEAGYKLDQAYDARVNLGASNEVQYSRHAAHDPYGNYGAVTQSRQATQGGQLVPVVQEQPAVYISQPAIVKAAPAVVYPQAESYLYTKEVPVSYQKQAALVYDEPAPLAYQTHSSLVYEPSAVVYKRPVAYGHQGGYYGHGY